MGLEHYSTRYREQQSAHTQLPLFQQCFIQAKMQKFHVNMATLDTLTWPACSERYPGLHSTQILMNICIVATTSAFKSYTPSPTT